MRYILFALMISVLAVFTACQKVESSQPESTGTKTPPAKNETVARNQNLDKEEKRITLADAKKLFDENAALFIDTRSENSYINEHIKGAENIPVSQILNRYKRIAKEKKVVVYCS